MKKLLLSLVAMFAAVGAYAWSVKFTNPEGWTTVNVWAWTDGVNEGKDMMGKDWPGKEMTKEEDDIWTYSQSDDNGIPTKIIFNDGSSQTGNLDFEDGATYNMIGVVGAQTYEHTVYFRNSNGWSNVYVYCWEGYNTNAYPGLKLSTNSEGLYVWTVETTSQDVASSVKFQFNNGEKDDAELKTPDILLYTEGAIYGPDGNIVSDDNTENSELTAPAALYLIGNLYGSDWAPASAPEFDSSENGVFSITGINLVGANGGDIAYFAVTGVRSSDWDAVNALRWGPADSANATITIGSAAKMGIGDGDSSWNIDPGIYDIVVNFNNATILVTVSEETSDPDPVETPDALYLLGNLENNNWTDTVAFTSEEDNVFTLAEANVVNADDNTYGYVTFVNIAEVDWDVLNDGAHRYGPSSNGTELTVGIEAPFYACGDSSWKILPGVYTITVNFTSQTVLFETAAVDAVKALNAPVSAEDVVYNLQGVKVSNPAKGGIYIVNGKKVVVK